MKKILIKKDLFNISQRLKSIDKNYYILFNKLTKKFEVHYGQKSSLQLVLPFKNLDKRTIDLVLKTKVENKKKLLLEMEENNAKLERESNQQILDEASFKLNEMLKYSQSKCGNIDFNKTYLTKWN